MPEYKGVIKGVIKGIVIFLALIFLIFGSFWLYVRNHYVVPIIMYHSVRESLPQGIGNRLVVSVKTFERQMKFLKDRNYNCLSLEVLVTLIKEKKKIPPKSVVITFDDGYKDNYIYAYPILKKYNIPAIIFVIINEISRPENDRLSWEEIKEMQNSKLITIASHTIGPQPLTNIKSENEVRRQIFDSKRILQERLGSAVEFFSYPEGRFDAKIRQWVIDAGYKAAVATNPGKDYPDDDIFALKRLRISENASNLFVFWAETNGYYTYLKESKRKHGKR